ncbi:MAG TPA: homoserine kinase [Candidatus Acidoferrales bacterium]|nr:homoserine kinase [Candidatus Acidoferrales bacterium]
MATSPACASVTGSAAFDSSSAIIVPATSANLGCAFDCAALALNLYLRLRVAPPRRSGLEISYRGPEPGRVPLDDSNLVSQAIRRVAAHAHAEIPHARIEIENEIPVGVGLGSSAAAIVVGILAGARLCAIQLEASEILRLAAEIEGHPDNVAAAYHGGFVVSARCEDSGEVLAFKTEMPEDVEIAAVIPELAMPTAQARAVLPAAYHRADSVHNLQRTALFVAAMFSGRFDLQREFFRDRLHQPYRSALIPGLDRCLNLSHPDLLGVFLSGAGSSVLAFTRRNTAEIAGLLVEEFRRAGLGARAHFLKAENRGARDCVAPAALGA